MSQPCDDNTRVSLIQGEDKPFNITVLLGTAVKNLTGLTSTDITLKLPLTAGDDQSLILSLDANGNGSVITLVNAPGGLILVTIKAADTALLKEGVNQAMELLVDDGTTVEKVQLLRILDVSKALFT